MFPSKTMNKIISILILCISNSAFAGIKKEQLSNWQSVTGSFYINTNDFKIIDNKLNFWVRNKSYKKRRLSIDCQNLIERESFDSKFTEWQPVLRNTPKYEIANQLCFLTKITGFTKERRQPSWVKRIIKISSENINNVRENEAKTLIRKTTKDPLPPAKELTKKKKTQFTFE